MKHQEFRAMAQGLFDYEVEVFCHRGQAPNPTRQRWFRRSVPFWRSNPILLPVTTRQARHDEKIEPPRHQDTKVEGAGDNTGTALSARARCATTRALRAEHEPARATHAEC